MKGYEGDGNMEGRRDGKSEIEKHVKKRVGTWRRQATERKRNDKVRDRKIRNGQKMEDKWKREKDKCMAR